jgi:hypothetical protein
MRLKARIARLEAAAPKPAQNAELGQAEMRERWERLSLKFDRLLVESQRQETLPLEEQLALQRQELARLRLEQREAPTALCGDEPGGLYERWQANIVRLLEIRILERDGLGSDTARELRENAEAFLRFGQPMASLPWPVPAADGIDQLREKP